MVQSDIVERVVAEVMRRLMSATSARPDVSTLTTEASTDFIRESPGQPESRSSVLLLEEKVLTADILEEKARGYATIQTGPRAVITPAARDWLRKQNVHVLRGNSPTERIAVPVPKLALIQAGTLALERLLDAASGSSSAWNQRRTVTVQDAAEQARLAIAERKSGLVLLLTEEPERAACLANREEAVRAAAVTSSQDVDRVRTSMNCNVFAVNGRNGSFYELVRIVKRIGE